MAVAVGIVGVNVAALAQPAGAAEVAFTERAVAVWKQPVDDRHYRLHTVDVIRRAGTTGGASTTVTVGDVACERLLPPGEDRCTGTVATVRPEWFKLDATLRHGRVQWRAGGALREVAWTGLGPPELFRQRTSLDRDRPLAEIRQRRRAGADGSAAGFGLSGDPTFDSAFLARELTGR